MTNLKGAHGSAVVEEELLDEEIHDEESAVDKFLGDSFSLERTGVIRPGIMVPKSGCPEAKIATYNSMVGSGASWKEISAVLGTDSNGKSWLTMRNVDYFTLRPSDCQNPSHAAKVKELYAQEGTLKKIPISFPFDDINKMIDVRLSAYTAGGLVASGKYRGNELVCEQPKQGDSKTKSFGRPEFNTKPCDPDKCQLYQAKKCKMRGGYIFRIPKVPGLGVWALYTSSFYTLRGIRDKMWAIKQMLNGWGTLSTLPSGTFYLHKIKKRVGVDQKEQWLVTVDTDLSVDEIVEKVKEEHFRSHVMPAATAAIGRLNGKDAARSPEACRTEVPAAVAEVFPDAEPAAEGQPGELPAEGDGAEGTVAPAAQTSDGSLDGDWPDEETAAAPPAKPEPAKTQEPAKPQPKAQETKPGEKATMPKNVEAFIEAISKNPALKGKNKDEIVSAVGKYSMKTLKKGLAGVDAKEAASLISMLQTDMRQGKIAEKLFAV